MADGKTNPNSVWGPNQYAAPAPSRPDASTVGPGGNVVDRRQIPKTLNVLDKNETPANPLGQPGTTGY
jgi:hypothetical protein